LLDRLYNGRPVRAEPVPDHSWAPPWV
jgi:hypothetical protein